MLRPLPLSLFAALFVLLPLPASAQATIPNPAKIIVTIDVNNGDLHAVVAMLERQTGVIAVVQDSATLYKPVQVQFYDSPLAKVLRAIADSAGAKLTQNTDGSYLFAPKKGAALLPINPADLKWHTIILQHMVPNNVIKRMHWEDTGNATANPNLPEGVSQIVALPENNSLRVSATKDGFQRLKEIVAGLDVAPRKITVHWEIVNVPQADWGRMTLETDKGDTKQQILAIQKGHYPTVSSSIVTTTDGVEATVSMQTQVPFGLPAKRGFVTIGTETKVKPRLNEDGSITLQFSLSDTELAGSPARPNDPPPTKATRMNSIHTFRPNETMMLGGLVTSDGKTLPGDPADADCETNEMNYATGCGSLTRCKCRVE